MNSKILNFSYSQGIEYARFVFHNLNGKINPIFPAKYLIFDLNDEKDVLGKSVGDIVIVYMHNILKLIDFTLKNQYELNEKKIHTLIAFVVIHELFHLHQDFNQYISQYSKENLNIAIEDSCNIKTIEFLESINNHEYYKTYFDLNMELFPYIYDIYNKVKNIKIINNNFKFYELQNASDRICYILNNLLFNNEDNLILWIKNKKWKFVYLEYKYDGIIQNGDLIYLENHFVNHNIILRMLDKLLLLISTNPPQKLKISEMKYTDDSHIIKIIINVLDYKPMTIISPLNLSNDSPILL